MGYLLGATLTVYKIIMDDQISLILDTNDKRLYTCQTIEPSEVRSKQQAIILEQQKFQNDQNELKFGPDIKFGMAIKDMMTRNVDDHGMTIEPCELKSKQQAIILEQDDPLHKSSQGRTPDIHQSNSHK